MRDNGGTPFLTSGGRAPPTHFCCRTEASFQLPCQRERTAEHQPSRPGNFQSLPVPHRPFFDRQSKLEGKAAFGSSPWQWLTRSGILTGGKNISLVFSAGCCHHRSFQDPVSMPRDSAASPCLPMEALSPCPLSLATTFRRPFPLRKRNHIVCPLSRTSTLSILC